MRKVNGKEKQYAASQAVDDVTTILNGMGYKTLTRLHSAKRGISSMLDLLLIMKLLFIIPRNSLLLYQHPMYFSDIIFRMVIGVLKLKRLKVIVLVHDLNMYRNYSKKSENQEMRLFSTAEVIITHNKRMSEFLISKGINNDAIVELGIFDYLVTDGMTPREKECAVSTQSIIVAGNLMEKKSGYLYKLIETNEIYLDIYGINYKYKDIEKKYSKAKYHGVFPADELPEVISGGFGLVWDGDSIDSCTGNYGEYLKINNPHKISLYLAAGIPVIVWDKAALAEFVQENELGFAVGSIKEAQSKIRAMDDNQYRVLKKNADTISVLIRNGTFTKVAIQKCELRILKQCIQRENK